MISRHCRYRSLTRSVEANRIQLPLQRRRFSRREIDRLLFRIDPFYSSDTPFSTSDLIDQLARIVVTIDVLPAVSVGDPEEFVRSFREGDHVLNARIEIVDIHPRLRRFRHHLTATARVHVEKEKLHLILRAIERHYRESIGSARPVNSRDVEISALACVEPDILSARNVDHSNPHLRIWIANERNAQPLPILVHSRKI